MPRGRSTSRARSASRTAAAAKRSVSVPTKIFGYSTKTVAAVLCEALAACATLQAASWAFAAGNRAASLGLCAAATAAIAAVVARILSFFEFTKKYSQTVSDFSALWTHYSSYFCVPLMGYTTLVSLGVVKKICEAKHVGNVCTGNGDMVDFLVSVFLLYCLTSSLHSTVGKYITPDVIKTATFTMPVFIVAVQGEQRRLAGAAAVYMLMTHGQAILEKNFPAVGKYRLMEMVMHIVSHTMARYLFQQ